MQKHRLLGQHSLVSREILAMILCAARLDGSETVLEIGPGKGILTRELAQRAQWVIAVEKDQELAAALRRELEHDKITNVELIAGDILRFLPSLPLPPRFIVVANIPYYLTSRLIRLLLERDIPPSRAVLMVQAEVAERIVARPPDMNLLGLAVQVFATPKIIASVPRDSFSPPPKVTSALITLDDISDKFLRTRRLNREEFFQLAKAAFSTRRKMLVNSLARYLGDKSRAANMLQRAGLTQTARPEELSLDDWARLASAAKS